MKKFNQIGCLLLLLFAMIACKKTTKTEPTVAPDIVLNASTCEAPSSWFTGAVPTPDPSAFPQTNPSNCDFHQVSWQYFLWLTEEVNGKLRLETMFTNKSINPEFKNDQYHVLDIVEQALSKGMLVDQSGRAVYSNIIINDIYRDWIIDNKLYDPEVYEKFDPTGDFPVGSLSLKASWKIVQPGEDVSKLYTTKSDIELLTLVDRIPRIDKNNLKIQKDVEVALVGLHIAIVVEGHPEFIWATFEFDGNAPDFNTKQKADSIVNSNNSLFYKANTLARHTNANNVRTLKFEDQNTQTLSPITQVARQYANGGGSANNQGNIQQLNKSVINQMASSAVWRNYFEVGAVWFDTSKGTLKPDWNPNVDASMVTGSLSLSNATIETFTQNVRSENSCFSCHNSSADTNVPPDRPLLSGKNSNLSHVLLKNYTDGKETPPTNN